MRILHVISSFGRGGAPSLIVNYMTHITDDNIKFDFLLRSDNNAFEKEIKECGGIVYNTEEFPKKILKNFFSTIKFFKEHDEYEIVHIHCNALIYILPAIIAKVQKRKCIIMHSHNTKAEGRLGTIIHKINRLFVKYYSDVRLACSDLAGKWLFGKDFRILKNAVDPKLFHYDAEARITIRKKYNIETKDVYLHVGRFETQKNHKFLMEIFENIQQKRPNSVLILIGDGSLKSEIMNYSHRLGIDDKVLFMGIKDNINDFLSAADVMIFPSLWEGLPVSLVEAQYAGLKVLCSDVISDEIMVSSYIRSFSLGESANAWADKVIEYKLTELTEDPKESLDEAGYNILIEAKKLEKLYNEYGEGTNV